MIQKRKRKELYDKFRQGSIPSGADCADLIRSQLNLLDDGIDISDNPDDPINFRAHGEEENILDFSDTDGKIRWRISGRSEDKTNEGLNIKADDNSKVYIDRDTGNVGVSTDNPEAKVHIKQTSAADAFRVDDESNETTPFIITSDGKVGIGLGLGDEKPTAKLHVNSPFEGDAFRVDDTVQDTTPFVITSDGYVGIGCSDPKSRLVVMGGVAIGENREVETYNIFVKGDLEVVGNMVMSGIEIDGPLKSKDKDLYIQDNVFVMKDPDNQAGSLGNLSVEGNTTLGTDINNTAVINGKVESGSNIISGEQQYELEINHILKVNRNTSDPGDKELVTITGNTKLGRNTTDKIILNGTVSSDAGDVRIDDNLRIEGYLQVIGASELNTLHLLQGATINEISTDNRLADSSNLAVPTERAVKEYVDNLLTGTVSAFAMTTPPEGWLECNGQAVSRIQYARLYSRIGVRFGSGDGLNTFNIPNLMNEFIRGWNHSRSFGSWQDHAFYNHTHGFFGNYSSVYSSGHDHWDGRSNTIWTLVKRAHEFFHDKWIQEYSSTGRTGWTSHNHNYTPSGTNSGARFVNDPNTPCTYADSVETRPRNIALMFCIKY